MKMTKPADISAGSRIRTICLPPYQPPVPNYITERTTSFYMRPDPSPPPTKKKPTKHPRPNPDSAVKYLEKLNNLTKSVLSGFFTKKNKNLRYNVRVSNESNRQPDRKSNDDAIATDGNKKSSDLVYDSATLDSVVKLIKTKLKKDKSSVKRSDKKHMFGEEIDPFIEETNSLDFSEECYTTGWGREQTNGNLTDVLLEAQVPVLPLQLCRDRYSLTLPLNDGHLCAGSQDGSTGACVVRTMNI